MHITVSELLECCLGGCAIYPLKELFAVCDENLSEILLLTCFAPTPSNPRLICSIHGAHHKKTKACEDFHLSRYIFD